MDLSQSKLSRQEWINLETAVPKSEKNILDILMNGYDNTNISINKNLSLIEILKIEYSESIDTFLYEKYFKTVIDEINIKYTSGIPKSANLTNSIAPSIKSKFP